MIAQTSTNNKPSAFLTRKEATLNHLVKQIALLGLESLTALGAVLLDEVDARAEAARLAAMAAAYELKEGQEA